MSLPCADIPLIYRHASLKAKAKKLCMQFNLQLADKHLNDWLLVLDDLALSLQHAANKQNLLIHFDQGKNDHRRRFSNGRQQPLSKAVGLDKPRDLKIIDATAGFGRDAFMIASLGAQVTMLERHPALAALLFDALERAALNSELNDIVNNIKLVHKDSQAYLQELSSDNKPDIIYLDPMYPERKKSALVKKEMQAAHILVGADTDSNVLLDIALETASRRVVVKRPKGADTLGESTPSTAIHSKNTRYDIYSISKLD